MGTALKALEELEDAALKDEVRPIYLVDGGYPRLYDYSTLIRCEKFIFGSPKREYNKIARKNPAVLVLYVPLFDVDELLECAKAVTRF